MNEPILTSRHESGEVVSSFLQPGWWAECSCGWRGAQRETSDEAKRDLDEHRSQSSTDAERVAARFHEVYELLVPDHGYATREASAVAWRDVPEPNRGLMIHVAEFLLREQAIIIGPMLPESWPVRADEEGS